MSSLDSTTIAWQLVYQKCFLNLIAALKEESIEFLVLKGAALSSQLYNDPFTRSFVDIDILVKREDLKQAQKLLHSIGFNPRVQLNNAQMKQECFITHAQEFTDEQSSISVDLHWRFFESFYGWVSKDSKVSNFFADSLEVIVFNESIKTINSQTLFLYLGLHFAKSFFQDKRYQKDIFQLLKNETLNYSQIILDARSQKSLTAITALFLYLVEHQQIERSILRYFTDPEISRAQKIVTQLKVLSALHEPLSKMQQLQLNLAFQDSLILKIRFILLRYCVPFGEDWQTVSLPSSLTLLYVPLKILKTIWKGLLSCFSYILPSSSV